MDVVIPEPMMRFACNERGCCCKGWNIPFRVRDVATLMEQLPASEHERLGDGPDRVRAGEDSDAIVRLELLGTERQCRFLEDDARCEVHRRFGPEVLPHICASFPAVPFQVGDHVEMHFSVVCPEVLSRIAEGPGAYSPVRRTLDADALAARVRRLYGRRTVRIGGTEVGWESLALVRQVVLEAINDESRPLLEVAADVSFALGRLSTEGQLEGFSVPEVADRQPFYAFFGQSVRAHSGRFLATWLRDYQRFVFDVPREDADWGDALVDALDDWEPPYRRWALPTMPQWLLRRYLAHRYFTVFSYRVAELAFSYGNIVHAFALSCRYLAALCAIYERPADVPLTKAALGAAEYVYHQLERQLPPESLPWFTPA